MFDKIANRIRGFVASVVAWQIDERYERAALRLLEQTHLGASIEWLNDLYEERGRHALRVAVHH